MAKGNALKFYGKKTRTQAYECRFVKIYEKDDKGRYSIELLVPTKEAVALNKELYRDNTKLQAFMKATKQSKMPKPLYGDVFKWDEENECTLMAEDEETGEEYKVIDKDVKVFRFKTGFIPKIQFKKGLDKTARIGWGSKVSISTNIFASTTLDENGGIVKYATLNLNAIRVFELVTSEVEDDWEDGDDDFEDSEVTVKDEADSSVEDEDEGEHIDNAHGDDDEDFEDAEEEEVAPKKKPRRKTNKSNSDF